MSIPKIEALRKLQVETHALRIANNVHPEIQLFDYCGWQYRRQDGISAARTVRALMRRPASTWTGCDPRADWRGTLTGCLPHLMGTGRAS